MNKDYLLEDETLTKESFASPPMYNVILVNDDYTTMEFVLFLLEKVFRKSSADSINIMLMVHVEGEGLVATYTKEIAEIKQKESISLARKNGFPLEVRIEPENK